MRSFLLVLITSITPYSWGQVSAEDVDQYVEFLPGDYPLILAVPHDGTMSFPNVPERTNKNHGKSFNKGRDTHTAILAKNIRAEIFARTGKKPYVVIMNLSRKWIDANRDEARAVEDEKVGRVYKKFYSLLYDSKAEIIQKYGKGLLLDIHCGQSWTYDVYFGNGGSKGKATIPLATRAGADAYGGADSIQKTLSDFGYEIPGYKTIPFVRGPTGSLIMQLTWADKKNQLDGIEIEINSKRHLFKPQPLQKISTDLTTAILKFVKRYYTD
jgi:hypothetical protein